MLHAGVYLGGVLTPFDWQEGRRLEEKKSASTPAEE